MGGRREAAPIHPARPVGLSGQLGDRVSTKLLARSMVGLSPYADVAASTWRGLFGFRPLAWLARACLLAPHLITQ